MVPNYIHLMVVMVMIIGAVVLFMLLTVDAVPKKKTYGAKVVGSQYQNDGLKLFLLLMLLVGLGYLHVSGFHLCEFLTYWMPMLPESVMRLACS